MSTSQCAALIEKQPQPEDAQNSYLDPMDAVYRDVDSGLSLSLSIQAVTKIVSHFFAGSVAIRAFSMY